MRSLKASWWIPLLLWAAACSTASKPPVSAPIATDSLSISADTSRTLVDSLQQEIVRLQQGNADTTETSALVSTEKEVRSFALQLLEALAVFFFTWLIVRGVVWLLETFSERSATRRLFFKKLAPIIRLLLYLFASYVVISIIFRIDEDKLIAASAALGVAIGFAAQDVMKNIFGGIIILLDQPFQVGDKISLGGTYGEVVSIGLRSTRIVTPDDNLVSVPNAQVVDGQVANANAGALDLQVVIDLYLPGWVDVSQAKAIAYEAAATSRYVYLEKPIVVLVKDLFKETFLTQLSVKAYVLDTRYEARFASDVTETAKTEFLRKGLLQPLTGPHEFRPVVPPSRGEPS